MSKLKAPIESLVLAFVGNWAEKYEINTLEEQSERDISSVECCNLLHALLVEMKLGENRNGDDFLAVIRDRENVGSIFCKVQEQNQLLSHEYINFTVVITFFIEWLEELDKEKND